MKANILHIVFLFAFAFLNVLSSLAQGDNVFNSYKSLIQMNEQSTLKINNQAQSVNYEQLVQITQIGIDNTARINVREQNYEILTHQNGTNNFINVFNHANNLTQNYNQIGNNNYLSDFSMNSYLSSNSSYNQRGDNLVIFNNGSNSISKEMTITQTGNFGAIYIFNR